MDKYLIVLDFQNSFLPHVLKQLKIFAMVTSVYAANESLQTSFYRVEPSQRDQIWRNFATWAECKTSLAIWKLQLPLSHKATMSSTM